MIAEFVVKLFYNLHLSCYYLLQPNCLHKMRGFSFICNFKMLYFCFFFDFLGSLFVDMAMEVSL